MSFKIGARVRVLYGRWRYGTFEGTHIAFSDGMNPSSIPIDKMEIYPDMRPIGYAIPSGKDCLALIRGKWLKGHSDGQFFYVDGRHWSDDYRTTLDNVDAFDLLDPQAHRNSWHSSAG